MSKLMDEYMRTFRIGARMKERMMERGLKEARAVCPRCKGDLRGYISGRKNHFRMACKGTCGMSMME